MLRTGTARLSTWMASLEMVESLSREIEESNKVTSFLLLLLSTPLILTLISDRVTTQFTPAIGNLLSIWDGFLRVENILSMILLVMKLLEMRSTLIDLKLLISKNKMDFPEIL